MIDIQESIGIYKDSNDAEDRVYKRRNLTRNCAVTVKFWDAVDLEFQIFITFTVVAIRETSLRLCLSY